MLVRKLAFAPIIFVAGSAIAADKPGTDGTATAWESGQKVILVVHCDKGAIMDSVINLLSNAAKYGGEPPDVRVRAFEDDGEVRISVADNGQGIEAREHKRIFQKFYRIDDRLAREREGSGLGLAIVDHVIRAHGGYVEIDSGLGKGSTFTLVLPRGK